MKIKVTSVHVDDQDKALRFYTEVLGFAKKTDFSQGPYRWLTVASPEEPDGTELQLALNNNPAAKAYQQADAEGHLRQPDSADATGTLFTLRRKKWAIASSTHRVRPAGRRYERTERSGRSFSSENCTTRRKKSGRRLLTQRICVSGRLSTPMGAWARLEPR